MGQLRQYVKRHDIGVINPEGRELTEIELPENSEIIGFKVHHSKGTSGPVFSGHIYSRHMADSSLPLRTRTHYFRIVMENEYWYIANNEKFVCSATKKNHIFFLYRESE